MTLGTRRTEFYLVYCLKILMNSIISRSNKFTGRIQSSNYIVIFVSLISGFQGQNFKVDESNLGHEIDQRIRHTHKILNRVTNKFPGILQRLDSNNLLWRYWKHYLPVTALTGGKSTKDWLNVGMSVFDFSFTLTAALVGSKDTN